MSPWLTLFQSIDLHIFCLMVLGALFISSFRRTLGKDLALGLFRLMALTIAVDLALEALSWAMDAFGNPWGTGWFWTVNTLAFLLVPLVSLVWALYADSSILRTMGEKRKGTWVWFLPFFFHGAMTLANLGTGWYFILGPDQRYQRGPLYPVCASISYVYLAATLANLVAHRRSIRMGDYYYLLVFAVFPVCGGIIQALFYGLSTIWPSFTLALVVIYLNIQDRNLSVDPLTGLKSRRYVAGVLDQRIYDARKTGLRFLCVMIDLDDFKPINDQFGHKAGDQALVLFGRLLTEAFRSQDFVCRYGGDEFLVVMEPGQEHHLAEALDRLATRVEAFNASGYHPWTLKYSAGTLGFDPKAYPRAEDFLHGLDQAMYREKRARKGLPA